MRLPATNLVSLLQGRRPQKAILTSFSLDEAVLLTLAHEGQLPDDTRVLFDRTRFRHFEVPRVRRRWLKSMSVVGRAGAASLPPVWHPKLAAFSFEGGKPLLVLSSANLAPGDQRNGNLVVTLDITPADFARLESWARRATPERTVLTLLERGRRRLILSNRSTWHYFDAARRRIGAEKEDWLIASPFLSPGALRVLGDAGKRQSLQLFARRESDAVAMAQQAPAFTKAKAMLPSGKRGFHQKVVAVRSVSAGRTSVVLYAGSANFTFRGFLGTNGQAENAEAGALFVGGEELWPVAQALARLGVDRWREVPLRCRDGGEDPANGELGEDDREESTAYLEAQLASLLRIQGRAVRLRGSGSRDAVRLRHASLLIDEQRPRPLRPGRTTQVPATAKSVVIHGDFEISRPLPPWWATPRHQSVQIDLPSTLAEVEAHKFALSTAELRRFLRRSFQHDGYSATPEDDAIEVAEGDGEGNAAEDVLFPWLEWMCFSGAAPHASVARWLDKVEKSPSAPSFWSHVASALRKP